MISLQLTPMRRMTGALCVLTLASTACASNRAGVTPEMMRANTQMTAMLDASDQAEVESSRLALSRSTNAEVRRYAQMMVDEHSAALQNRRSSMQAMGMSMSEVAADPMARSLMENHQQAMRALSGTSGAAFDRMYMQRQADMHAYLLSAMQAMEAGKPVAGSMPSAAPMGGIAPQAGGYAVPLSCDPGTAPGRAGSGREEAGNTSSGNTTPRGNCAGEPPRPPMHANHAAMGAMGMAEMHRVAAGMIAQHHQMARQILSRM